MTHFFGKLDESSKRQAALLAGVWLTCASLSPADAVGGTPATAAARVLALPVTSTPRNLDNDLDEATLTALVDQQVQRIRSIHPANRNPGHSDDRLAWQVVIYFDAPLSTKDGLRKAAQALSRESERLTLLGPTEIVLAGPTPRIYLEGSLDPAIVREALLDVRHEALTTGELQWHRQRYSASQRDEDTTSASQAFHDEEEILAEHRTNLFRWTTQQRSFGPKLLILVQNGHDLNPREYYDEQVGRTFLEDPQGGPDQVDLARAIASEGWTVLSLALGPRPTEFVDPSAPLFDLARQSGGEVIYRHRDLIRTLDQARLMKTVRSSGLHGGYRGHRAHSLWRSSQIPVPPNRERRCSFSAPRESP